MRTDPAARALGAAFAALALALLAPRAPAAGADLAVVAGTVHAGGRAISPAVVEIRDGRITRIVAGDSPSAGLPVLDARHLTVLPGLVDARSGAGLPADPNEEASEVTPGLVAVDLVDSASPDFDAALSGGVTTVAIAPGGRAVIGGQVGVLKTAPGPLAERILARDAGLSVTLGLEPALGNRVSRFQTPVGLHFRRPGTRMGVVAEVRRAFHAVADDAGADGADARVLRRAASGERPSFMRVRTEGDIRAALRLAAELGLRPILTDVVEGHRIPEEIAAAQAQCILGPLYNVPRAMLEYWEGEDVRQGTAALLAGAGVTVAIATGPEDSPAGLRDAAILAARGGLPEATALAAITTVPARLLGVEHRVGDIAPGLDGDLLVLDGGALDPSARVAAVVVSGRIVLRDTDILPDPPPSSVESASPSPQRGH